MTFKRIEWTPDMSVGVDRLDEDHKQLVNFLNEFIEAIDNDEGVFVTDGIFAGLLDYTASHFAREERIMEACGYPDLETHKKIHEKMAAKVVDCRQRFMMNPSTKLEGEVREFLENWLQDHILKCDGGYKAIAVSHPEEVKRALDEEEKELEKMAVK